MAAAASATSIVPADFTRVTWKRGDGSEVFGYTYGDATPDKPALIVVQEWWGIEHDVMHNARKFANAGFVVLVPDIYRGKLGVTAEEAHHLMSNLNWPGAIDDIRSAAAWLKVGGAPKVGITGFCMGGALSIASAVLVDDIAAASAFYGIPSPKLADPAAVKKPVQGHFGETDSHKGFSDVESAKALEEKLKAAGVEHEIFIYPGVGHAFMNETETGIKRKKEGGNGDHDPAAVALATERTVTFFRKHLSA